MARRDFPRTPGYYANGDVAAGSVGFGYEYDAPLPGSPNYAQRRYLATVADPAIFVGNLFLLPVNLARHPPSETRVYQGAIVEPTYTAAVPLPPDPVAAAEARPAASPRPEPAVPAARPASRAATFPVTGEPLVPPPAPAAEQFGTRGRTAATLPATRPVPQGRGG